MENVDRAIYNTRSVEYENRYNEMFNAYNPITTIVDKIPQSELPVDTMLPIFTTIKKVINLVLFDVDVDFTGRRITSNPLFYQSNLPGIVSRAGKLIFDYRGEFVAVDGNVAYATISDRTQLYNVLQYLHSYPDYDVVSVDLAYVKDHSLFSNIPKVDDIEVLLTYGGNQPITVCAYYHERIKKGKTTCIPPTPPTGDLPSVHKTRVVYIHNNIDESVLEDIISFMTRSLGVLPIAYDEDSDEEFDYGFILYDPDDNPEILEEYRQSIAFKLKGLGFNPTIFTIIIGETELFMGWPEDKNQIKTMFNAIYQSTKSREYKFVPSVMLNPDKHFVLLTRRNDIDEGVVDRIKHMLKRAGVTALDTIQFVNIIAEIIIDDGTIPKCSDIPIRFRFAIVNSITERKSRSVGYFEILRTYNEEETEKEIEYIRDKLAWAASYSNTAPPLPPKIEFHCGTYEEESVEPVEPLTEEFLSSTEEEPPVSPPRSGSP